MTSPAPKALVTGGARRLGRQIVESLAEKGFEVAIHCNQSIAAADALAAQLREKYDRQFFAIQADLMMAGAGTGILQAISQQWDRLDVLVHSAADYKKVPFEELTPEAWDAMQALNTRAPALLTRVSLPLLRHSSLRGGGLVLNLVDIAGERPAPGFSHYCVSKAGLHMLTRALAVELAPAIRVNGISPGTVLVPEDLSEEDQAAILKTIPQGHFGGSEDIGKLAAFLALECPHVTGQIWSVDGGRSVSGPLSVG
ncbi:MAG: SDR family oxidoreductase [Myxococcota bacterium]|nr:SDR family oxidoreductase [Myxococcota bacterium]